MQGADIRNGQRGHHYQDDPAPALLSAEQAAPLLGCSVRHVRRLIASGALAGHKDPYRTWRSALDAYRHQRSPREGDVVCGELHRADTRVSAGGQDQAAVREEEEDDASTAVMVAIAAELAGAREQIERLARENGRLQALLDQRSAPKESVPAGPTARRRIRGPLARLLALLW